MNFEAFNFAHKRVRTLGTREWKLWFTALEKGLAFRMLTKDTQSDCYMSVTGLALMQDGDLPVQEDDSEEGYFTIHYRYETETGVISFYLDKNDQELAWVNANGEFGKADCTFAVKGPLMPEIAG